MAIAPGRSFASIFSRAAASRGLTPTAGVATEAEGWCPWFETSAPDGIAPGDKDSAGNAAGRAEGSGFFAEKRSKNPMAHEQNATHGAGDPDFDPEPRPPGRIAAFLLGRSQAMGLTARAKMKMLKGGTG